LGFIIGLAKETLEAAQESLANQTLIGDSSQLAASAVARQVGSECAGLNPFALPGSMKSRPSVRELEAELARLRPRNGRRNRARACPPGFRLRGLRFGAERFQLPPHNGVVWACGPCSNEWKKVSDLPSIKEAAIVCRAGGGPIDSAVGSTRRRSIRRRSRPSRCTQAGAGAAGLQRRPHVYRNTEKKLIYAIIVRLNLLGHRDSPGGLDLQPAELDSRKYHKLYADTQFGDGICQTCRGAKRFKPNNRKARRPRSGSHRGQLFSMTQVPGDLWSASPGLHRSGCKTRLRRSA